MIASMVHVHTPRKSAVPLVLDSPHSGRIYPDNFNYSCPLSFLRQTEDFLVDELIMGALDTGATVITAEFPRCYIDVNRSEDDLDPAVLLEPWPYGPLAPSDRTLMGLGLIRRLCRSGIPVYNNPLPVRFVQERITTCYRPYHMALASAVSQNVKSFGQCYLLNCHSMPDRSEREDRQQPDFVLGDRDGTSCDPSFTRKVHDALQDMGYNVWLNDPFKGVEILRRYGLPKQGQHALQLEINRGLYMIEEQLEKTDGFQRLQKDLKSLFRHISKDLVTHYPSSLAAE